MKISSRYIEKYICGLWFLCNDEILKTHIFDDPNSMETPTQIWCYFPPYSLLLAIFCRWHNIMMTSSNGDIFRVTGPLCGEITGPGEFPTQRPVTRSFDGFFYLCPNKRLNKQPWGWWFETPSWSLWRQRNVSQWCHVGAMTFQITSLTLFHGNNKETSNPRILFGESTICRAFPCYNVIMKYPQ